MAFDYGGVLTATPFSGLTAYEAELGLGAGVLSSEFRGGPLFREAEVGRRAVRDVMQDWRTAVESTHGVTLELRRVYEALAAAAVINPYMIDLLRRIELPLALITNNVAEGRARWQEDLPVKQFTVIIDSSEVGLRKPDPEIYALLVERLALPSSEVVLVDDFEENVEGARAAGLQAIHFQDGPSCEAALAALGVPIASLPGD